MIMEKHGKIGISVPSWGCLSIDVLGKMGIGLEGHEGGCRLETVCMWGIFRGIPKHIGVLFFMNHCAKAFGYTWEHQFHKQARLYCEIKSWILNIHVFSGATVGVFIGSSASCAFFDLPLSKKSGQAEWKLIAGGNRPIHGIRVQCFQICRLCSGDGGQCSGCQKLRNFGSQTLSVTRDSQTKSLRKKTGKAEPLEAATTSSR